MMWLGVDGGGTKTAFTLYDEQLRTVDELVLGTCHYAQAGFDGMESILTEGVRWAEGAACAAGTEPGDSSPAGSSQPGGGSSATSNPAHLGLGFGICGYGEGAESTRRIEGIVARVSGEHPYTLVNDVDAAWAAGLDLADGIAIIAGTGSIASGVCRGQSMRCGGWDYELGDEGSGGWLGKELLYAFTRQADGRSSKGAIYDLVRQELSLADDFDIIAFAQEHFADRGRISSLAPLVALAANQGDPDALRILERAAGEEAELVRAIVRQLFKPALGTEHLDERSIPVTYIGGTFNAGEVLLDPLRRALPRCCKLVAPIHEPSLGPVLILRERLLR